MPLGMRIDHGGHLGALQELQHQREARSPGGEVRLPNRVGEVRPVEARDALLRVLHSQQGNYVLPYPRFGRGGEGEYRDSRGCVGGPYGPPGGKVGDNRAEEEVLGPEGVAPLRDAVGLVHDEERDAPPPRRPLEEDAELKRAEPFGGNEEYAQGSREGPTLYLPPLPCGHLGVQRRDGAGVGEPALQRLHLVLHQADQRAHYEGDALPRTLHEGGDLVAQRLAAARGHDGEGVAAREHGGDGALLATPEALVAEDRGQDTLGRRSVP